MVQVGQLMYALLECIDGRRDGAQLARALSEQLGRRVGVEHVARLAQKLAGQGLLAGTEHRAPPRRNPLLALRWKVLVTNPKWTRRLTAPFAVMFRPWLMWPIMAAFLVVFWFVLIHKGVAAATAQAFHRPGLLLLVFVLAVMSAGFHELGHAAACRYGGATPGGMGMGLYLVWPAFYTDVTDAYRLPRRDRLRVDLAGLYFNAAVAVITMAVWLVWRADALLLLVALQILQMVKQLSPVIRADGYHILSDATGVPDLYAHLGPTLRRLLPGHRNEPSALTGRARLWVTLWVLLVVPVLLALMLGAILLFPRLATTAWESGRALALAIPHQVGDGQIIDVLASLLQLVALLLPVVGSVLVIQRIVRGTAGRARTWSRNSPARRTIVVAAGLAALAAVAWAWWPSGQYQQVRATQGGTLTQLVSTVTAPAGIARPAPAPAPLVLTPGTHLAVSMIPVGGATRRHPALFVIAGRNGQPGVAFLSRATRPLPAGGTTSGTPAGGSPAGGTFGQPPASGGQLPGSVGQGTTTGRGSGPPVPATAFPFQLPATPGPGGSQALAQNTTNGGVVYDIAYSLVTVKPGEPVTNTNTAFALAHCQRCTTVAVSFQIVLVVGQAHVVAPINAAGALNYKCPACTTTALADQIVVTLKAAPTKQLLAELQVDLQKLHLLRLLGARGTPAAIAAQVATIQHQIVTQLNASGLLAQPLTQGGGSSTSSPTGSTSTSTTSTTPSSGSTTSTTSSPIAGSTSTTTGTTGTTTATTTTTTTSPTTTTATSTTSASTTATTSTTATSAAGTTPGG
jgi:putative peptide zinc metalloprotease protein